MPRLVACLAFWLLLAASPPAGAVGFDRLDAPDPQGAPLALALWYPSDAPAVAERLGPFTQTVARGGAIRGESLPLVLISHGAGGNLAGHHDTALALAEAGFVAAALNHAGDTTGDTALAGTARGLAERPRQLRVVLDFLLRDWPGRDRLDPGRIGAFGFSAGGFTVLVAAGGEPDLRRILPHCEMQPADASCRFGLGRDRPGDQPGDLGAMPTAAWAHAPQLRAVAAAAPALGYAFAPRGLAGVAVPVQLWRAGADEVLTHPWHAEMVRRGLPQPPEYHEVPEAGHYAFLTPCPEGMAAAVPELCLDAPGFDRAAFHRQMNQALVAFFRTQLRPAR